MTAALAGRADALRLLARRGASLELLNRAGATALHMAVEGSHLDAVVALLDVGASIHRRTTSGDPIMGLAAERASAAVCELLLARSARIDEADAEGDRPLMRAVIGDNGACIPVLVRRGVPVEGVVRAGLSALIVAARENGHADVVTLLAAAR